jgi:hypothetical protein
MSRRWFVVWMSAWMLVTVTPLSYAQPLTPVLGVAPSQLDFATVLVGFEAQRTLRITNINEDPQSILYVTEVAVSGDGHGLTWPVTTPLAIAGDSPGVVIGLTFAPADSNAAAGQLRITAMAPNSPIVVPLTGEAQSDNLPGQFAMRFDADALDPTGRISGHPSEFSFNSPDLAQALEAAAVFYLGRVFSGYEAGVDRGWNLIGEEVALIDLSLVYAAYIGDRDGDPIPAVLALRGMEGIAWCTPRTPYHALILPNDTHFPVQWGLHNTGQFQGLQDSDINAPLAWDRSQGYAGTWIGIIDSGIDSTHVDFGGRVRNAISSIQACPLSMITIKVMEQPWPESPVRSATMLRVWPGCHGSQHWRRARSYPPMDS